MAGSLWVFGVAILLTGCGEKITVYQSPKEPVPKTAAHGAGNPHADEQAPPALPKLKWGRTPEGWKETEGGTMRAATFALEDETGQKAAEVAVLPFPGAAGLEDKQLVNMWREQLGLPAFSDEEVEKQRKLVKVGDAEGRLYDVAGGENSIVSVIAPHQGWMWFFKLAGKKEIVERQKSIFVEFLKDVSFVAPEPLAAPSMQSSAGDSGDGPDWKPAAHWSKQAPGMMQMAKYSATGEGGAAEISVSRLGGMAGGLGPNINRWRGQLGLSSVTDAEADQLAKPIEVKGGAARVIDLAGESGAMSVVMVSQGGATWFYKLTGPGGAVERERAALVEFVNSVNYN